jgi:truncated hemoglobin YjbI
VAESVNENTFKTFQNVSGFSAEDLSVLAKVGHFVIPNLPRLTDLFYERLLADPSTAVMVDGRVDILKKTHIVWLNELFSGIDANALVARQEMIGHAHVKAKVPPVFVAASMSFLRSMFPNLFAAVLADKAEVTAATAAILRTLDVCQYLIDRAYLQCLMDNLGIKPALLNRLMTT